ncbi:hypothetical protein ACKJSM_06680 [Pseudomonas sp. PHC1]|uniref:hypothetical protein n=1 Tax=Pseudomonas sp. PHC1 TaxID=3384759 RepID=UPI00396F2833
MKLDYSVLIVGACVMLLPAADDADSYSDLVNSVLLAQLAASKKVEKSQGTDWYDAYIQLMDDYWLRYARARQDWSVNEGDVESVSEWISGAIAKGDSQNASAALATLQRLAQLSGAEPVMALLRAHVQRNMSLPGEAHAPAGPVRLLAIIASTPMRISSVYVEFQANGSIELNPLAQRYEARDIQGAVCLRYAKASLSETLYGPVRDAIALKVRDRHAAHVLAMAVE